MAKTLSWLIGLIMLTSCYRNTPEAPFDESVILSPDSMVSLLKDVHLIEGVLSSSKETDSVIQVMSSDAFNFLLTKYGLDRRSFEENIRYYSYHAEELDEIYETVINDLGKLESEILARKDEPSADTGHLEKVAEQE